MTAEEMFEIAKNPAVLLGGPLCGDMAIPLGDIFLPESLNREYLSEKGPTAGYFKTKGRDNLGRVVWKWYDSR